MAYQMISTNGQIQYNVNEFIIDKPEDLKKLPNKSVMGSTAFCISNSMVYIKNSQGQWVSLDGNESDSGSGSSVNVTSYNDLTDKPILNGTVLQGEIEIDTIPINIIDNLGNSL